MFTIPDIQPMLTYENVNIQETIDIYGTCIDSLAGRYWILEGKVQQLFDTIHLYSLCIGVCIVCIILLVIWNIILSRRIKWK